MDTEITLTTPFVNLSKVKQHTVVMRSPVTVADWRYANKRSAGDKDERTYWMVQRMSGLDEKELDQLALADFQALTDKVDFGAADPKDQSDSSATTSIS